MGYSSSNAAYAYDMQPQSAPERAGFEVEPQRARRPRFDVLTGAGREADQQTSPEFVSVIKAFCVLAMVFIAFALARVTISTVTASVLNANADLTQTLESERDSSSDLEVMRSVYGSQTRIRDLATGTLGMVDPDQTVTIDLGQSASSDAGAESAQ